MDQKAWLWRKKPSEKTILANSEEVRSVTSEKEVELENALKTLNEKLASVVDECSAKDELVQSCKTMVEDALADKEKAEEEKRLLKEELDEVQQQKMAANERLGHLNSALKDCMDQLNLIRQEQDQRICDAVMKTSKEFEKSHKKLDEKLSETSKRVASLTAENSYLSKALLVKEKLIEDLNIIKTQTEAEFNALMTRLDSVEKENSFLRYEFMTLEKELDLRNEEVEYNRRSAEASRKQQLDNVKKMKKLEAECKRLRALTHIRFPGPVVLSNIQRGIDVQGRNPSNMRRKGINGNSVVRESSIVLSPDNTDKQLSFLIDQVQDLLKENKIFKECLTKKEDEIFHLRKVKNFGASDELSLTSIGDSNEISSSCSRAIALVSSQEDDQSNGPKTDPECKMIGSEMSLMDDFVEMEKLAIVAVDSPLGVSLDALDSKDTSFQKPNDWLQIVRNAILDQHNVSQRSIYELLGDVRMCLNSTAHSEPSNLLPVSGYLTWKLSPNSGSIQDSSTEMQLDVNRSIDKMIELVGRFDSYMHDEKHPYKIHVFGWKMSELTTALQEFLCSCNNLVDGKINFEKFIGGLSSILEWIVDKSVSNQDHSSVQDEFKKHLGGGGPGTALGLESVQNLMVEMEKMHSVFQVEIEGLKKELNAIKSSDGALCVCLQNEMEILKESKRTTEDQMENLKVINEDLDTHLAVTRAKLNEVLQKLSSVEVELDNKSQYCEELEGTCLELQLQLESVSSNQFSGNTGSQEGLLQTGMEITKASVKLAQCEETIMKLGKQLKALNSAKELSVVDKVLSITDNRNKKIKQRSSLRDQMLCEDNGEASNLESPKTKEIISATKSNVLIPASSYNPFSFPDGQAATLTPYRNEMRNVKGGALVIVPSKKRGGGVGFLKKLLLRRKKASSKNTPIYFSK